MILGVRISIRARCTTLCDKVSNLLQVGGFQPGTPVSSTNKTDRHDITEILLKVVLNTIKQIKIFIQKTRDYRDSYVSYQGQIDNSFIHYK